MVAEPELVKQVLVKDFSLLPNRLVRSSHIKDKYNIGYKHSFAQMASLR